FRLRRLVDAAGEGRAQFGGAGAVEVGLADVPAAGGAAAEEEPVGGELHRLAEADEEVDAGRMAVLIPVDGVAAEAGLAGDLGDVEVLEELLEAARDHLIVGGEAGSAALKGRLRFDHGSAGHGSASHLVDDLVEDEDEAAVGDGVHAGGSGGLAVPDGEGAAKEVLAPLR